MRLWTEHTESWGSVCAHGALGSLELQPHIRPRPTQRSRNVHIPQNVPSTFGVIRDSFMNFGSQVSRVIGLMSKNPNTLPRLSLAYGNLGFTQAPA